MEMDNITLDDIRKFDAARSHEVEKGVRKELAELRMDVYQERVKVAARRRQLKKRLAQILTIRGNQKETSV
jgi:ribosomal protein L29